MISLTKKRIALISVDGDPSVEIGKEEAGGQNVYVRQVGEALAKHQLPDNSASSRVARIYSSRRTLWIFTNLCSRISEVSVRVRL
jgi:hypothetical protein